MYAFLEGTHRTPYVYNTYRIYVGYIRYVRTRTKRGEKPQMSNAEKILREKYVVVFFFDGRRYFISALKNTVRGSFSHPLLFGWRNDMREFIRRRHMVKGFLLPVFPNQRGKWQKRKRRNIKTKRDQWPTEIYMFSICYLLYDIVANSCIV